MVDVADFRTAAEVIAHASAVAARIQRMRENRRPAPPSASPPPSPPEPSPPPSPAPSPPPELPSLTPYDLRQVAVNLTDAYCIPPNPWAASAAIDNIKRIVCEYYAIRHHDLIGRKRTKDFIRPRHVGMYLACELTGKSLPEIGRRFGHRDHTSVMHARDKIRDQIETDTDLADQIRYLTARIRGHL